MEDREIVELYWERSEAAISETERKYGKYCFAIALRICDDREDAEECVNDTYLRAWNSMPPHKPEKLSAFLGKLARNLALNRYKERHCEKRGQGQVALALEELQECVPNTAGGSFADDIALRDALNRFLRMLPHETRAVFMQRYWYVCSISDIAAEWGMSESRVKMLLLRTRNKLKQFLEKEGIEI